MRHLFAKTAVAVFTLSTLAAGSAFAADNEHEVYIECVQDNDLKCITLTLQIEDVSGHWNSFSREYRNTMLDRVTLSLDDWCSADTDTVLNRYGVNPFTKTVSNGHTRSKGNPPMMRSFTVPAGCPYRFHAREPYTWEPDVIHTYEFPAGDMRESSCVKFNIHYDSPDGECDD